jgi:hypothetical protein
MKYILLFIIIIIFLTLPRVKHFILTYVFATIAPTTKEDISNKKTSDYIYKLKTDLENEIKLDYSNECILNKVKTVNFSDIVDKFNKDYFEKLTDNYTQPVLIKRVYDNKVLDNFTVDKLVNSHGDVIVEAIKTGSDGNIQTVSVPLKEYIKMINNGEKYYLTVNNSIASRLNISEFSDFYDKIFSNPVGVKNIFLGNKHSSTHLHSELPSSCALQLSGIKKWYLIDPKYSDHLHSIPDKNKIFHVSSKGFLLNNENTNNIPHYEIIAEEGDFLYVPPWWWHEALNLTDNSFMYSFRPTLFKTPYKTNLSNTMLGIKNSLAYNDYIYPILVKNNIVNLTEDTVVNSLREIYARVPDNIPL